jgi:hypothetical protein
MQRLIAILIVSLLLLAAMLVLFSHLQQTALADAGPPLEESNEVGSWLSPYPFIKTRVRMVDEQVFLKVEPTKGSNQLLSQVLVNADFHLKNTSSVTESMQVIFPLSDLHCPWIVGPGSWTIREHEIDPQDFTVQVNNAAVPTVEITTTSVISSGIPGIGNLECLTIWKGFDVVFPPNEDVNILVRYSMNPGSESAYPWDSFTYILKTGAGWYGQIGSVDVRLQLPYPANREYVPYLTAGYRINGNLISWRWKDLEPQENIRVVAMSPYSWQELHNNYQKTIENPQDAEAWFNLARILDSLSGRYDYNESCSLPTGGYAFKTIKQWSYAQQAVLAYRNAIDLEPDWADPQENLALLLASISLSGNNGKIQLFYPSTRQAVQEFERALVIKPDSYTQQALIDFQRCASEGCQCGY